MPQHRLHRNCIINVLVESPTGARKHPGFPLHRSKGTSGKPFVDVRNLRAIPLKPHRTWFEADKVVGRGVHFSFAGGVE